MTMIRSDNFVNAVQPKEIFASRSISLPPLIYLHIKLRPIAIASAPFSIPKEQINILVGTGHLYGSYVTSIIVNNHYLTKMFAKSPTLCLKINI